MKKTKLKVLAVLAALILAAGYYYAALPALNLHSADLWMFLILLVLAVALQQTLMPALLTVVCSRLFVT